MIAHQILTQIISYFPEQIQCHACKPIELPRSVLLSTFHLNIPNSLKASDDGQKHQNPKKFMNENENDKKEQNSWQMECFNRKICVATCLVAIINVKLVMLRIV